MAGSLPTKQQQRPKSGMIITWALILLFLSLNPVLTQQDADIDTSLDRELRSYVENVLSVDEYSIIPGLGIERVLNVSGSKNVTVDDESETFEGYINGRIEDYARTHVLTLNLPETGRFLQATGKSSFLTGFGMGFLAFALKKLLLPFFIGAQLLKSVLIAMFLPSILGSVGKLLGKGLSTFSGLSAASAGMNAHHPTNQLEEFEFKETNPYDNNEENLQEYHAEADTLSLNVATSTSATPSTNSRFGLGNQRISYMNAPSDNYYMRKPTKKTDFKVFHKIPSSSMLLTSYDPFYSPLLSRLDVVFQQLGLGNDKSPETERCRERLVCLMYANPAKYAPYSNLVSAQLSRELNELRKPTSDNPDILRFFRYMKAAKDGQDGDECRNYGGCRSLTADQPPSPAILTTYNEINKLVQARKMN